MAPETKAAALSRRAALTLLSLLPAGASLAQGTPQAAPSIQTSGKIAPGLYEIAYSALLDRVLVASAGSPGGGESAILLLDPSTLAETGRIALPEGGFGVGLNDRTGTLYVTHTRSGAISAVDLRAGRVAARLIEGEKAHLREVVVDEAGNRAFASVFGSRGEPSAIWMIDGAAGRIAHVMTEGLEGGITGLAPDTARNRLFATALTSNEVVEIDLATNRVLRRFPSGGEGAVNIAVDASGRRLFVTNQRSGTLSVLNAESGALIRSVPVGAGALGVAFDAGRQRVLTANRMAGTVSVVDARSLEVLASLEAGTHPNTVAIDTRGGRAFVTNKARSGRRGEAPPEDLRGDTVSLLRI